MREAKEVIVEAGKVAGGATVVLIALAVLLAAGLVIPAVFFKIGAWVAGWELGWWQALGLAIATLPLRSPLKLETKKGG